jgi:hypothetical protein
MDELQQAYHELDRLQEIISRHEGHIFSLRGWLLTVLGGLLAAYYTNNIHISELVLRISLPLIALLFFVLESRHANLVEAVVERVSLLERLIAAQRHSPESAGETWYDGPKITDTCNQGASRVWPRRGMTLVLNLGFYLVVTALVLLLAVALPPR